MNIFDLMDKAADADLKKISGFGCGCLSLCCFGLITVVFFGSAGCGNYSDGERTGILQKISQKGFFVKTWEAEVALSGFKISTSKDGGSGGNVWSVTIDDPAIAKQMAVKIGKEVTIAYHQFMIVNPLRGDSDYRVKECR